jgi:hypothetical protein
MTTTLERLRLRMEAAAAAEDFELAARLRDQYSLLRGRADGGEGVEGDFDTSGLRRQQPGRMGLGTSEQAVVPPPGWTPPKRPDPMTTGTVAARRRRR